MGKMKNQTRAQKEAHTKAVAIRKMSDERLCEMSALAESAQNLPPSNVDKKSVYDFLNALDATKIAGIGKVTLKKIREFAQEQGF